MQNTNPTELTRAMQASRNSFIITAFFSFFINLLMLAGPLYMLQVYDRVLTSNSIETLVALSVLLLGMFLVSGFLEFVRSRILSRVGTQVEARVSPAVFDASIRKRVGQTSNDGGEGIADLASVRDFLSGNGLPAFFDLPWVPVYLLILAILHPVLGLVGIGGALFLVALAWLNNSTTRKPLAQFATAAAPGRAVAQASESNAEVVTAMGMVGHVRQAWMTIQQEAEHYKTRATDRSGMFSVMSKTSRLILQSAVLGVGAALVIAGEMTAGAMIAGTIILGRGLAPIDQSISHWRSYTSAKAAYARLSELLARYPAEERRLSQPQASKRVNVERVFAGPPGARKAVVSDINFSLTAGDSLAVLGPSASGKSTLARLLAGVWIPQAGNVRLDGVAFDQWNREEVGPQIGYLPQDVELFDGTVAQNIARFQADAGDMEIVAAAEAAGVHDMILRLPNGYETEIGEGGRALSGGQRQRLGLARAMFREPFLTILDEPNANLDTSGDEALIRAIKRTTERGGVVIVVSHRPNIIKAVQKILILDSGRQQSFGAKEDVIAPKALSEKQKKSNVTPLVQQAV